MRDISFRAKRSDNGEWIEGYLFSTKEHTYIAYSDQFDDDLFLSAEEIFIEVDPETVCQHTGLTDRNGKKIFEGDIVRDVLTPIVGIVRYGRYRNTFNDDEYGGHVGFYVEWKEKAYLLRKDLAYWIKESEFIGNVFDNPQLLCETGQQDNQAHLQIKVGSINASRIEVIEGVETDK